MSTPILTVENLTVTFTTKYGRAAAVNDVSFSLQKGEKLGLVGESGSGKSVTSKSIIRLLQTPPARIEGSIRLGDVDLLTLSEKQMQSYRGNHVSMIFQEPMVSLNPLYSIGNQLSEIIRLHSPCSRQECERRVVEMLRTVGIPSPETRLRQYPFELSGGMRQRVMIAMALLCQPEVLIADEPTTALDVTIQAQILDLLRQLNQDFGTSIILITHDLGVIAEMADKVAVMYAGSIVETAQVRDLFHNPLHPYTRGLLTSLPSPQDDGRQELSTIEGNVPSIYNLPPGCAFHNRCKYARGICSREVPPTLQKGDQCVKCWMYADKWEQEVQE
ncbi:MAG: ABC transporter ATP-binding protein [Lawsonibacter sp.]|nr:ABC transporter ATP-binding protein [Lawsonibacter sp.]